MGGGILMESIKRRVSYEQLKTIVDIPYIFSDKDIEITISAIEPEKSDFEKLRGSVSHIKMSADEAREERLSGK